MVRSSHTPNRVFPPNQPLLPADRVRGAGGGNDAVQRRAHPPVPAAVWRREGPEGA